jgi:hypothetical protein
MAIIGKIVLGADSYVVLFPSTKPPLTSAIKNPRVMDFDLEMGEQDSFSHR